MRQLPRSRFFILSALAMAVVAPIAARADLTFINAFGTSGTGNGQFNAPTGIVVGPGGSVYVSDTANNRIEVFTAAGTFLSAFGAAGTGNGQFNEPVGLAIAPNNNLYVVDSFNHRVQIMNPLGGFVGSFGATGSGNGQFNFPNSITASPAGNIYVDDISNKNVQEFTSAGVYVATIGGSGTTLGKFNPPTGLAITPAGDLAAGDGNNGHVLLFSSTGNLESSFGTPGTGVGQFGFPGGIAVASSGYSYVQDAAVNRIEVFNSANTFQSTFGTTGTGNGQFGIAAGSCQMAITPTGFLYVADQTNNRVQRLFDPNAWTSGTNNFTDPTTGPTSLSTGAGQILGQNFTLTSAMGLNLSGNLVINSNSTFTQAGGPLSAATLTMSGRYNYQGGSTSFTSLSLNAGGILTATQGGTLNFSSTSAVTGLMTLDGGTTFASPSGLTIVTGGIVNVNNATLLPSSISIAGGQLLLNNAAASFINCPVFDTGLLSGGGFINSNLTISAGGQVAIPGGQTLTVTGGSSSLGLLTLSGGAIHFTQLFTNANAISSAAIQGFGTLRFDAGLHNSKFGTLALAGSSGVYGNITNDVGATIHLQGTQPNVFFNSITNNGSILIDVGASATFYGNITGNAPASAFSLLPNSSAKLATPQSALATTSFSISGTTNNWNASLDLNGGALVVESAPASKPTTLSTLRNQVLFAKSNSAGITSTGLAANMAIAVIDNGALTVPFTTFFGQPVDSNSLLVAPELLGDANADGAVDLTDLSTLLNNFGSTTPAWTSGNFDGASTIDLTDLSNVLNNFGASNPLHAAAPAPAPEPASLLALATLFPLALRRRQK